MANCAAASGQAREKHNINGINNEEIGAIKIAWEKEQARRRKGSKAADANHFYVCLAVHRPELTWSPRDLLRHPAVLQEEQIASLKRAVMSEINIKDKTLSKGDETVVKGLCKVYANAMRSVGITERKGKPIEQHVQEVAMAKIKTEHDSLYDVDREAKVPKTGAKWNNNAVTKQAPLVIDGTVVEEAVEFQ